MESLQTDFLIMAHSLGWALCHSIWQALLIYCALKLILGTIGNPSPRLSYNLSYLALCGVFIWFLSTWILNWHLLTEALAKENGNAEISLQAVSTVVTAKLNDDIIYHLTQWLPIASLAYLGGVAFLTTRFIYNYYLLEVAKTKCIVSVTNTWLDKLSIYKEQLHIRSKVSLLFSEYIDVPMVIGVIKPLVLVPMATLSRLNTQQFEAILVHELAHIKRNDYFLNIVQVFMETILFFNPFAWALSGIIRREREHCCDDIVLEHTGAPLSYAHALAALETTRQTQLAVAATGNKNLLFNRIKRIMELKKKTINSPAAVALLASALAISLICLTPLFAQTSKKAKKEAKTTTKQKITIIDDNGKARTYSSIKDVPAKDRATMVAPPIPPQPLTPVKGVVPTAPIPPVPPITPVYTSGITDSSIAIAMETANKAILAANLSIAEANKSLAAVDWKQINEDVEKAMKEVDWKEINADIEKAMKEVDWKEINAEVEKAQKEAKKAIKEAEKERKKSSEQSW